MKNYMSYIHMLNLFNTKTNKHFDHNKYFKNKILKYFSSPLREWDNSIYTFNKNSIKLIPSTTNLAIDIIKSYFNLFNHKLERKATVKRLKRRLRRISSNKYYISNGGFKHTNDKLIINLYVFNRQKQNYITKLKKKYFKRLLIKPSIKNNISNLEKTLINLKNKIKTLNLSNIKSTIFSNLLLKHWKHNFINNKITQMTSLRKDLIEKLIKSLNNLSKQVMLKSIKFEKKRSKNFKLKNKSMKRNPKGKEKLITKTQKKILRLKIIKRLRLIKVKGIEVIKIINNNKTLVTKALNKISNNKNIKMRNINSLHFYAENFYKNLIKKTLRKMRIYFYYKQLLFINKSKLNYNLLQFLKVYLQKIYNKNVEFNIINVKRFYLDSNILSESASIKISKNRKKMRKFLNNLINKVKLWNVNPSYNERANLKKRSKIEDISSDIKIKKRIINNLKYKHITGFRLEAKGRLSKRFTASRSIYKVKYKGNLLDVNASYRGMSSSILRNNLKSNIQYTNIKSKSRIGSFGIKGWVNGN